jgi:hypothetical protein
MLDSIKGLFADGPLGDKNTRQMIGLQMLANSGPTVGAPGNLFAGMPQAVMAGKQLSEKQREKMQEEERRRNIAKALAGIDGIDPELAQFDPDMALKVRDLKMPKAPELKTVGDRLYNPATNEWITPPDLGGTDMKVETDLRKEYSGLDDTRNYTKVRDAYERVRASAQRAQTDQTGASDMAIVFNYMKMLDPGSTVREGEFQSAAESGGYGPRIQNIVSNIAAGKILTNAQRQEFVDTAAKLYEESLGNLGAQNERYTGIAEANRVDPSRVIMQGEQYEPLKLGETRAVGDGTITIKKVGD